MELYLMRHGETIWNANGITQGRSNNKLSKNGRMQAFKSSETLKNVKLDFIISSPLRRTIETSNIVNQMHKVKIIRDERIIEVDQGLFTGRKYASLTEEEKLFKSNRDSKYKMEQVEDVAKRCKEFYSEILDKYKDKSVLVVTHNMVASCLELISQGVKDINNQSDLKRFKNAEVKRVK